MPPKFHSRRKQPPKVDGNKEESRKLDQGSLGEEAPSSLQNYSTPESTLQPHSLGNIDPPRATTTSVAGSPTRKPVPRLASLNARQLSASLNPSSPDVSGSRLKYRPKSSIRRTKEEREAAEKAEVERRQSRLSTNGPSGISSSHRGAFQARGGRSLIAGIQKYKGDRYSSGEASGHLGGGTVGEERGRKRRNARSILSQGAIGSPASAPTKVGSSTKKSSIVKPEKYRDGDVVMRDASHGKGTDIKKEEQSASYVSSDEDEPDLAEGPKVNIEHINLISDEDSDNEKVGVQHLANGSGLLKDLKAPTWTLKPIRIDRHEHIERTVGVNINASSLSSAELRKRARERGAAEGSLFIGSDEEIVIDQNAKAKVRARPKDVEFVRDERRWKGVYQDDDGGQIKIKEEPKDDTDMMSADSIYHVSPTPNLQASAVDDDSHQRATSEHAEPNPAQHIDKVSDSKPLIIKKSKPIKPVLQTEEDRQEWARYENELLLLREELSTMMTDIHKDDNFEMQGEILPHKDRKEGLVYLFQLPPTIPRLIANTENESLTKARVEKREKSKSDLHHHVNPKAKTAPLNAPEPRDKSDQDFTLFPVTSNPHATSACDPTGSIGKIGTLRVYESGRTLATWGGVSMELGRCGGGGLLQEILITDFEKTTVKVEPGLEGDGSMDPLGSGEAKNGEPEKEKDRARGKWEEKISLGTHGWAMGEVEGGFIMVPDWDGLMGR